MFDLSQGEASLNPLIGSAISESAVWACTSCGACIDICPVGNEPMLDILDIRRDSVLVQGEFPAEFQNALNGMERQLRALWGAIDRAIERTHFPPRTSALCNWCSFQSICPAFEDLELEPAPTAARPEPAATIQA